MGSGCTDRSRPFKEIHLNVLRVYTFLSLKYLSGGLFNWLQCCEKCLLDIKVRDMGEKLTVKTKISE